MRFHHPEPLVDAASDLGEDVGGNVIPKLTRMTDGLAGKFAESGQRLRARSHGRDLS